MTKQISRIIMGFTICLIVMPFVYILKDGLRFVFTFPYPPEIFFALKNSIKTALISTCLCILMTIGTSYSLRTVPYSSFWNYLISVPLSTPHIVSGIALLFFFGQLAFGKYLTKIHIDFVYTVSGIVLAQLFVNLPYSINIMNTIMRKINPKKEFVARSLGLNERQVLFHVIFPMIKKDVISLFILIFSRALGEFGAIMMLVGVSSFKTETLATSIFLNMSTGDLNRSSGISVLLILLSVLINFIFFILARENHVRT